MDGEATIAKPIKTTEPTFKNAFSQFLEVKCKQLQLHQHSDKKGNDPSERESQSSHANKTVASAASQIVAKDESHRCLAEA